MITPNQPVLYAEDEEDDVFFMQRAFAKNGVAHPLVTVPDGQQAMDYLAGLGRYSARPASGIPGLVLLDLNMPIKSGFEVIKWMRAQSTLASLPIIVLTSSSLDRDVQVAVSLGADAYLVKPSTPDKLGEMLKTLKQFGLQLP